MRERVHDEAAIDRLQAAGEGVRRLGSGVELGLGLGLGLGFARGQMSTPFVAPLGSPELLRWTDSIL